MLKGTMAQLNVPNSCSLCQGRTSPAAGRGALAAKESSAPGCPLMLLEGEGIHCLLTLAKLICMQSFTSFHLSCLKMLYIPTFIPPGLLSTR